MRLVLIEWVDAAMGKLEWHAPKDSEPGELGCRSVGWLLHDHKDYKTVVPHRTVEEDPKEEEICGDITIPAGAITRMVDLEPRAIVGVDKTIPYVV